MKKSQKLENAQHFLIIRLCRCCKTQSTLAKSRPPGRSKNVNPTYPFRALSYHVRCVKNKVSNFFPDARPFLAPCHWCGIAVNWGVYYY